MAQTIIPFNKPYLAGKELYYIAQSVLGGHTSGDGPFTKKCQALLENKIKAPKILLTHSATAALEMAALLCKVKPGDEVLLPSFTFVSTANAFYLRGAKPTFIDIREDTLNIDENLIETAITPKSRLIIPVHYAGVACEMDTILEIAQRNKLLVIEDAAQGVNATYKDKYLGTIGDLGAFSFHETKNLICGEGGALVINNPQFLERAEIIREKGTNRSKFFRGEIDKYTWVDIGSSYLPSDMLAAFLYAQLENMDPITHRRDEIFNLYYDALRPLAEQGNIQLPYIEEGIKSNSHLFYLIVEDESTRNRLLDHLKTFGINSVFHYLPLHLSPIGLSLGYQPGQFPVTESISKRLIRLPFYYDITKPDQLRIVDTLERFFRNVI